MGHVPVRSSLQSKSQQCLQRLGKVQKNKVRNWVVFMYRKTNDSVYLVQKAGAWGAVIDYFFLILIYL